MIIIAGGIKGGSGKTTSATNFAVMRASEGKDVLLVDADEQETATIFTAIRKKAYPHKPHYTLVVLRDDHVRTEAPALARKFDDIIIDTGGRDSRSQRAALAIADILLIPFNPRSPDIWTLENDKKLLDDMLPFNPNLQTIAFLNRADSVGADNEETLDILRGTEWTHVVDVPIVNRKSFGKAIASGLSILELRPVDQKAAVEITALYRYVFGMKNI